MKQYLREVAAESRIRDLLPPSVHVEYVTPDPAAAEEIINARHLSQYILAQPVYLNEHCRFTGMLRLGESHEMADVFSRIYHKHFKEAEKNYYNIPMDNLATFEWQHSTPNYEYVIQNGLLGVREKIRLSKLRHADEPDKLAFLQANEIICDAIEAWSNHCADVYAEAAANCTDAARKCELLAVAANCRKVPLSPCGSFYEGLQCVTTCFQYLPDSIGTIDRYLKDLYFHDLETGVLTREEAKELLQEFFIYISNFTPAGSVNADKTAECHFAVGGYTADHEDGFTDLSRLVIESVMELDTRRPAISLRWTKKTPFEVLRFVMDCERHDPHKRLAFVNDEPRLEALQSIIGLPFEQAVRYTMVGCNEPAFPGTLYKAGLTGNLARSMVNTMFRHEEIFACRDFEEFYAVYRSELENDVNEILSWHSRFETMRSKDNNVLSSFLIDGAIENAVSPMRGGCRVKLGGFEVVGLTCVIDSLTVIRQFVFDEKKFSMRELVTALKNNWNGFEDMKHQILKHGRFFGNNEEISNTMARRLTGDLYALTKDRTLLQGEHILIGTLVGYNPHHAAFGALTPATPDGRNDGEAFMIGTGQARNKDRNGLASLMDSVSACDPSCIMCGATVCNLLVEDSIIKNDERFEVFCRMMETYFQNGGLHAQLTYVSKEDLLKARKDPSQYAALRVRVSGFSAAYVNLSEELQLEILNRTVEH